MGTRGKKVSCFSDHFQIGPNIENWDEQRYWTCSNHVKEMTPNIKGWEVSFPYICGNFWKEDCWITRFVKVCKTSISVLYNVTYQLQICDLKQHSRICSGIWPSGRAWQDQPLSFSWHCWGTFTGLSIPIWGHPVTALPSWPLLSAVAQVGLVSGGLHSSSLWQCGLAPKQVSEDNQVELV